MGIDSTLKSLINPIVAGGCHNVVNASSSTVAPYVVFHEISSIPKNGLDGYMGITQSQYQIDVFAKSPEQAKALALGTIKGALITSTLGALLTFHMVGDYSDLDKTYQYITEYTIWAP